MSRMGKSLAFAGAALLAVSGILASGTPASAHWSQCPDNEFCFWDNSNYEGIFAYSSEAQPNVGDRMNDVMTSYWNRTDGWISVYKDSNYGQCMLSIPPGGSSPNVGNQHNDEMTSFRPGAC